MPYYFEDGDNVRYNRVTVVGEGGSVRANRVLDVSLAAATTEPVTLAEVKTYCKIDNSDDDTLLTSLISAARAMCEAFTNISFVQRTATVSLNNSLGCIYLPYGPVGNIASMVDEDGTAITSDNYEARGTNFKQLVTPVSGYIKLTYPAGYATLPDHFKTALKAQIAWMYENRDQGVEAIGPVAKTLLNPYKRTHI